MSRKKIIDELVDVARNDINDFINIINEVLDEFNKFIPFIFEKGKPKTEEEVERERKWIEEQEMIAKLKKEHDGEYLALTRRGEEVMLIAHGMTTKELHDGIIDAIKRGVYDNENECIFYE